MAAGAIWRGSEIAKSAEDLAEDNKRLQEMLHAALRREAEALRRVKHLSELLGECRVASRTPSSGPDGEFPAFSRSLALPAIKLQRLRASGGRTTGRTGLAGKTVSLGAQHLRVRYPH